MTFPIRLQRPALPILLLFGVVPGNAWVQLLPGRVLARFGFFSAAIGLDDVERWTISGPYRWWRAIGLRGSPGRPELTFGGSTHGAVCLHLRRPVSIARRDVRELYLTVDDLEGFAAELSARGIAGQDLRHGG